MSVRDAQLGRHLIDTADIDSAQIMALIETADQIQALGPAALELGRGRILATLFWEPSTRTRLSFESAMLRLGGQVIGFSDAQSSSASKGESLADTVRILSLYADIIAMRHPGEGAALAASRYATIPVINAGDGAHLHPTQTLGDLYTIYKEKGRLADLVVGFQGDLRYGRTVHSLARALARFGAELRFYAPDGLELPQYVREDLQAQGARFHETGALASELAELDVVYSTRLQKERFQSESEYQRFSNWFVIDRATLANAKPDLLLLHPLPRNQEIAFDVDGSPQAGYFRQAGYGVKMRMALIASLLGLLGKPAGLLAPANRMPGSVQVSDEGSARVCSNPKCISRLEPYLTVQFVKKASAGASRLQCEFCEH